MIKAPETYDINEQYDFYRQYAYRRYNKGGLEAVLLFLSELMQENPLIYRILKKQYRSMMNDEQSADLNQQFQDLLEEGKNLTDPKTLALYTAAALYDRSTNLTGIIKQCARRSATDKNFMKPYNRYFYQLQSLTFFSPLNQVQFIYSKYQIYNPNLRYRDLYQNITTIVLDPEDENRPLVKLFNMAVIDHEFKYLWFLTRILQNTTLAMAEVDEEILFEAGKGLSSNQYVHYICFCIRMYLRNSDDPKQQKQLLDYCCRRLCAVLKESKPDMVSFVETMQLVYSIVLDPENSYSYIDEYQYQPAEIRSYFNDHLREMSEKAFEILFHQHPQLLLPFIQKLREKNPYHYTETRDFQYAARRSNAICLNWINTLKEYYTRPEIRDIFMNSILRSCFPLTLFLRELFQEKADDNKASFINFLKDYKFIGQINRTADPQNFEVTSYSFRNEYCLIKISRKQMTNRTELVSQFLDNPEINSWSPVKFTIKTVDFSTAQHGFNTVNVSLAVDWQVEKFHRTREYNSYTSSN